MITTWFDNMPSTCTVANPILYQNSDQTMTLLDIPQSISESQGTSSHPCRYKIRSVPALQKPYPSLEPKSTKAKANVLRMKAPNDSETEFPEYLLRDALEEVAKHHDCEWCLERPFTSAIETTPGKKRKVNEGQTQVSSTASADPSEPPSGSLLDREANLATSRRSLNEPETLIACDDLSGTSNVSRITGIAFHNSCPYTLSLRYSAYPQQTPEIYRIPPRSSFFVSKINQDTAMSLSMAALKFFPEKSTTAGPAQFDFILLDPPWENRSVKRGRQYNMMVDQDPLDVLKCMLEPHIAPQGLLACWITNKTVVRVAALEAFHTLDVQMVEEWAWLKTTAHGEPMTDISGIWRKPYEILLLGRKRSCGTEPIKKDVQRRVVIAVPDLHSRKPNLKALIEPIMQADYRALEIFGRNLTAGWFTWGDECLKYTWDGCWSQEK